MAKWKEPVCLEMKTDYTDLCAQLESVTEADAYAEPFTFGQTCREAAAAIRELDAQKRDLALDVLAASGQAQDAYEAQLAAEAKLVEVEKAAYAKGYGDCETETSETAIGQQNEFLNKQNSKLRATVATLTAQVEAMRGLLKEARDDIAEYVNADYPEEYRAKYPDMDRRYQRDMELCRRIDAALTTENQTNG